MKISFVVGTELAGQSIKQYFEREGLSTTEIKRFKYDGRILANGQSVTVRYTLQLGDKMEFATNERLQTPAFAQTPASLLYADNYLYVAYKPYGVAIHPDLAHHTETFGNMLATTFGEGFALHIVTRLDKTTDGLVLGTLDEITAQKLNDMQYHHKIQKTYVATVEGHLCGKGTIDLPLLRQGNKTIVDQSGKEAKSFYTAVEHNDNTTVVQLTLGTGRTHQLRAHLSAIGHPIVGDKLYGSTTAGNIELHCVKLAFAHPHTGEQIVVRLTK
jgi:23S rRNA pseudouridine1911/1915/1917 synthase